MHHAPPHPPQTARVRAQLTLRHEPIHIHPTRLHRLPVHRDLVRRHQPDHRQLITPRPLHRNRPHLRLKNIPPLRRQTNLRLVHARTIRPHQHHRHLRNETIRRPIHPLPITRIRRQRVRHRRRSLHRLRSEPRHRQRQRNLHIPRTRHHPRPHPRRTQPLPRPQPQQPRRRHANQPQHHHQ